LPLIVLTEPSAVDVVESVFKTRGVADWSVVASAPVLGMLNAKASQGCALKLSIWELLPPRFQTVVIVDVDTIFLEDVAGHVIQRVRSSGRLVAARDLYVGYKENMGEAFRVLGRPWSPSHDDLGRQNYINTGLLGVRREHAGFMGAVLEEWRRYVRVVQQDPPLWDQGVFNYCLDIGRFGCAWEDVDVLEPRFNALKEYELAVDLDRGCVVMNGESVGMLHFNGGSVAQKLARRSRAFHLNLL
jgi:hypothetical protein